MNKTLIFALFLLILMQSCMGQNEKLKIGVIGLTHTHVHWIFGSENNGDFKIEGIVEPNTELAERYAEQYDFAMNKVYKTMDDLLEANQIEAVCAFGTIYEHLEVVEKAAPLGIHVMVEKPLAVSYDHALMMEALAKQYGIHLLTNYETTWYPSNHKAFELLESGKVGELRKVVVRDGHKGPKKIGVNQEFLDWLTDPVQNGGGAITDFGCYGINLMTCMMKGEKPLSVAAFTQQLQAENNPKVDDDATIILEYAKANATIQASWDWPIGRKDMEIYGLTGVIYADNRHDVRVHIAEGYDGFHEEQLELEERPAPYHDPFSYFSAVIKGKVKVEPYDLSALENNMMVMEILDAAIKSAKSKRTIELK